MKPIHPNGNLRLFDQSSVTDKWLISDGLKARFIWESDFQDSWGNYDGSPVGNPSFSQTAVEGDTSVEVDGTDDGVNYPYVTTFDSYTICSFARSHDNSGYNCIMQISDGGMFQMRIQKGSMNYYHRDGGGTWHLIASPSVNTNQWYHVAQTWDGSTVTAYLDGSAVGSVSLSDLDYKNNQNAIGYEFDSVDGGNKFFDGEIDDSRVYQKGLSASQISDIANGDG